MENKNINRNYFEIMPTIWHGWEVFKKEWKNLLMVTFAYIVAVLPPNLVDFAWNMRLYNTEAYLPEGATKEIYRQVWVAGTSETVFYFLFAAIMFVWSLIVGYNWYKSFYGVYDGKQYVFGDMFKIPTGENFKNFVNYVGGAFAYMLIVMGGLILLIIPGIYLAIRYGQSFNLILDKKMGIKDAFVMSAKMTDGIKWRLIGASIVLGGMCLGIFLVGLIALIVGIIPAIFVVLGWCMMTSVGLYRKLYEANK
jgi:hypothetical protein